MFRIEITDEDDGEKYTLVAEDVTPYPSENRDALIIAGIQNMEAFYGAERSERAHEDFVNTVAKAAKHADWQQVVLNGGPPCFHLEADGSFCFRTEWWDGHDTESMDRRYFHPYISLSQFLESISKR